MTLIAKAASDRAEISGLQSERFLKLWTKSCSWGVRPHADFANRVKLDTPYHAGRADRVELAAWRHTVELVMRGFSNCPVSVTVSQCQYWQQEDMPVLLCEDVAGHGYERYGSYSALDAKAAGMPGGQGSTRST